MQDLAQIVVHVGSSPNPYKVVIMLEEIGLPYVLKYVDVLSGEQFSPEFLELNPLAKVPVLVDESGVSVFESGAILFYLAERSGQLLPTEGPKRYEVMQWLMVQMALLGPMFGQLAHFRGALQAGAEPYAEGRYAEQTRRVFEGLNARLEAHEWVAAGQYSIADIAIYPWARVLERFGFNPSDFPAVIVWRNRISLRPAVVGAAARMDEARASKTNKTVTDEDLNRFFGRSKSSPLVDFSKIREWRQQ